MRRDSEPLRKLREKPLLNSFGRPEVDLRIIPLIATMLIC